MSSVPRPFASRVRLLGVLSLLFLAGCLAALHFLEPFDLVSTLPPSLFTAMVTAGAGLAGAAIMVRRTVLEQATRNTDLRERLSRALLGYLLGFAFTDLVGLVGVIGGLMGGSRLVSVAMIAGAAALSLLLWPRRREVDSWGRSLWD